MYPPLPQFYDRSAAALLAGASAAAHGGDAEIRAWAAGLGGGRREIIRDTGTDTVVFAAQGSEDVVVCFRGTADLRNWLTDLDCRRVGLGQAPWITGIRVHEGFQKALASVWEELAELISSMAGGTRRVWFTGHSLGGALAMLAAGRVSGQWQGSGQWPVVSGQPEISAEPTGLTNHWPLSTNHYCYTFGQPRVGNAAWGRWYDARLRGRTFRVIHADDVVARVPWLWRAYRHCGTEVFYPAGARNGHGACLVDAPWWRKAPSDVAGFWQEWRQGRMALLADHRVETYVNLLGGMEKSSHGSKIEREEEAQPVVLESGPTEVGIGAGERTES